MLPMEIGFSGSNRLNLTRVTCHFGRDIRNPEMLVARLASCFKRTVHDLQNFSAVLKSVVQKPGFPASQKSGAAGQSGSQPVYNSTKAISSETRENKGVKSLTGVACPVEN